MASSDPLTPRTRFPELLTLHRPENRRHFAQFYKDDAQVIENVAFLAAKVLKAGNSSVLIATESHLKRVENRLAKYGFDLHRLRLDGRYAAFSAEETLSCLMVDDWPNDAKFNEIVGDVIRSAAAKSAGNFVLAFGEMVALLCASNKAAAVVRLEQLWNSLAREYQFSLCCAYPLSAFVSDPDPEFVFSICAEHSLTIPAEVS